MQDVNLAAEESPRIQNKATFHRAYKAVETGGRTLVINHGYALQLLVDTIDVNSCVIKLSGQGLNPYLHVM